MNSPQGSHFRACILTKKGQKTADRAKDVSSDTIITVKSMFGLGGWYWYFPWTIFGQQGVFVFPRPLTVLLVSLCHT